MQTPWLKSSILVCFQWLVIFSLALVVSYLYLQLSKQGSDLADFKKETNRQLLFARNTKQLFDYSKLDWNQRLNILERFANITTLYPLTPRLNLILPQPSYIKNNQVYISDIPYTISYPVQLTNLCPPDYIDTCTAQERELKLEGFSDVKEQVVTVKVWQDGRGDFAIQFPKTILTYEVAGPFDDQTVVVESFIITSPDRFSENSVNQWLISLEQLSIVPSHSGCYVGEWQLVPCDPVMDYLKSRL